MGCKRALQKSVSFMYQQRYFLGYLEAIKCNYEAKNRKCGPILVESSPISFFANCNLTYFHRTLLICREAGPQQCKFDLLICFKDSLEGKGFFNYCNCKKYCCGERERTKRGFLFSKYVFLQNFVLKHMNTIFQLSNLLDLLRSFVNIRK